MRRLKTITAIALAILTIGAPMAAAAGPHALIAHRGVFGAVAQELGIAESGLKALTWAEDNGADILDTDVVLTTEPSGSHKLAASHDVTADRVTTCSGEIYDHSLDWFKACLLELPDGTNTTEHPASLNQVLDLFLTFPSARKLTLETKGPGWSQTMVNRLRDVLRDKGLLSSRVIVHSFSESLLLKFKSAGIPARGIVVDSTNRPSVATVKSYVGSLGAGWAFCKLEVVNEAYVQSLRAAGVKVAIWTLDNQTEYGAAMKLGDVDGWVVNDLLGARKYLASVT
jgi:glycerophosphoryl diester phosphodiesterase